jgi:uncharacterized protein involved in response to NO
LGNENRSFFLLGALWAAIAILIWLPVFAGEYQIPTIFPPALPSCSPHVSM